MKFLRRHISASRLALVFALLAIIGIVLIVVVSSTTAQFPVLKSNEPSGTRITAQMLEMREFPIIIQQTGNVISTYAQVVGSIAQVDLSAGDPILKSELGTSLPGAPAASSGPGAVSDVNKLAIFMPFDLRHSSGGTVSVGGYVDIFVTQKNGGAMMMLQKVHVVGARSSDGQSAPDGTLPAGVLLSLTSAQASTILALDPSTVFLVPTTLQAANIPGVPSGQDMTVGGFGYPNSVGAQPKPGQPGAVSGSSSPGASSVTTTPLPLPPAVVVIPTPSPTPQH